MPSDTWLAYLDEEVLQSSFSSGMLELQVPVSRHAARVVPLTAEGLDDGQPLLFLLLQRMHILLQCLQKPISRPFQRLHSYTIVQIADSVVL